MMRWCLLMLLYFSLPAWAQKFSAADVRLLKLYGTGSFSNEAQVKAGVHAIQSSLKVQPIWPKRKDGIWLFAEKTDTSPHYQLWHFYLQDDTTVLMQFLDFKTIQKAQQLSQDIKQQSGLSLNNLLLRRGCELYCKKNKSGYTATSSGKDCLANKAAIEYITYNILFTKNSIVWQETGFDKDEKQFNAGTCNFIKQVNALK
ncbi:MAG: CpcT/CpeT family chromophore lyase [Bacteroidota bacterium]